MTALLWLRRDLRLGDNPALDAAVAIGSPVIPVYICDDAEPANGRRVTRRLRSNLNP
jgi:deoxyribodipyrimidine photo-lyase